MKFWIIIAELAILGIGSQSYADEPQLKMIEEVLVADSAYNSEMGIDFDFRIPWWQWRAGIIDTKPRYLTYSEAADSGDFSYRPKIRTPSSREDIDSARIPNIPISDESKNKRLRSYIKVLVDAPRGKTKQRRLVEEGHPLEYYDTARVAQPEAIVDSIGIWLLEERFNPSDSDTNGAHFQYFGSDKWQTHNSRYQLIVLGDTVGTIVAGSSHMPAYPINQKMSWKGGYSFIFQRDDGDWNWSIHAFINGEDLNQRGYDATLAPAMLDGKLFFLFRKNDLWGWFYDGEEHPGIWERVYYNYGDGEGSVMNSNPRWNDFYALRDGLWYMVRFERAE